MRDVWPAKAGKICRIVGAGDGFAAFAPLASHAPGDLLIAADGGLKAAQAVGVTPDVVLGDFDSLGHVPEGDNVLRWPEMKDDTDMMLAIRLGLEKGYRTFYLYGGCGGRLDHTLANIQCLLYLKNHGAVGYLVDGTGMVLVLQNEAVHFRKELEGTMSLFALTKEAKGVNIRGMKYPLENAVITNDFPIGISNEFLGEEAEVSVEDGELVCMIRYYEDEV